MSKKELKNAINALRADYQRQETTLVVMFLEEHHLEEITIFGKTFSAEPPDEDEE